MQAKRKMKMKQKPSYIQLSKAVNYWVVFQDVASFFDKASMPEVSRHLMAACNEIDRIWAEDGALGERKGK